MFDNSALIKADHKQWFYTAQHLIDFVEFLDVHVENMQELHDLFIKQQETENP